MTSWRTHTGDHTMTLKRTVAFVMMISEDAVQGPVPVRQSMALFYTCRPAVTEYVAAAASKSDLERTELSKQKTGVFTGANVLRAENAISTIPARQAVL